MDISRLREGTKVKILKDFMDVKAGTIGNLVSIKAGDCYPTNPDMTDEGGHYWVHYQDGKNARYCQKKTDFKVLKY